METSIDSVNESLPVKSDLHITRKIWHVCTGLIGTFFFMRSTAPVQEWAWFFFWLAAAGFGADLLRMNNSRLNSSIVKIMSPFLRESERNGLSGLPFYALGVSITLFLYSKPIAFMACLFLIIGDPISSFAGIKFGSRQLINGKSLEGFMAGFAACFIVCLGLLSSDHQLNSQVFIFSILAGFVGALSEFVSGKIDDNLTIPILSGMGITLINKFIPLIS